VPPRCAWTRLTSVSPQPISATADAGSAPAREDQDIPMNTMHPKSQLLGKRLVNPALIEHARERRQSVENRIADRITAFSGSMRFVYLHVIWFTCWIALGVEAYPYGLLTMIVSLEAIFLSTFVMISQNRADQKREVLANQQWETVQEEDKQNEELLKLSHQILELTKAVHLVMTTSANGTVAQAQDDAPAPSASSSH
jgi:uncharacterized membrane protein